MQASLKEFGNTIYSFNLHFFLQGLNILDDFIASNVITHHTMQTSNSIQSDLNYQTKITNPMNN